MPNEVIRTERTDKIEDHYEIGDVLGKNCTITGCQKMAVLFSINPTPGHEHSLVYLLYFYIYIFFLLGKGAFGTVRLAKKVDSGKLYACKSISKARLVSSEDIEDTRREIEILHLLSPHKTLADLKEVYEDRENVHIIMQYCTGGELFDRIIAKGTFSEAAAAKFFRQMVEMVAHCHNLGVMHRDIKPENFLLSSQTDDADLVACDFGLGTFFKPGDEFSILVGSPYYVAPEVLRRKYSNEADIWSLGVVLYILLCGLPPFWGSSDKEIFMSILRGNIDFSSNPWPSISQEAKNLVRSVLTLDPSGRPTIGELLSHPWLKENGVASDVPIDSVVVDRMKQFAAKTRVRKAAILIAAQHLGADEIQGLKELFNRFDVNGDGSITFEEFRQGLRASANGGGALSDAEIENVMKEADMDGSGTIDYNEFLASTVNTRLLQREDLLRKMFLELDVDGNGTLSLEEIEMALCQTPLGGGIDHAEVLELVKRADSNGDGVIDFDEFVAEWRKEGALGAAHAAQRLKRGLASDTIKEMNIEMFDIAAT
jgi:calcium-dependent protein kinase